MKKSKYLIREFTEFNAQRFNPDSVQASVHVDDPKLSVNAFDKHEDLVRQAVSRIGQLQGALSGSAAYRTLKSKLSLEDQEIQSLKIIRILKDGLKYDVYFNFKIDEEEYWGVVKDIAGNCDLKSEVFKDHDLIQTKEWVIKIKGIIIKNIKSFLKPIGGIFKCLVDHVICYSNITGKMLKMKINSEIEVLKSYDDKIIFEFEGDKYTLTGDNFIYFNWWFEKIED
jgi:hypothetical protein